MLIGPPASVARLVGLIKQRNMILKKISFVVLLAAFMVGCTEQLPPVQTFAEADEALGFDLSTL